MDTGNIRKSNEWQREKRKRLRVAGKEYVNTKGLVISAKNIGSDCKCRRNCYVNVPEDIRKTLFDSFYKLSNHSEQNAYLFPLIKRSEIGRKRNTESDRRSCTFKYYIPVKHEREVQVCRNAFASIYGISIPKIRILCNKIEQNVIYPQDERGRHSNRPNKLDPQAIELVKEHIKSIVNSDQVDQFKQTIGRQTSIGLSISKMWDNFSECHKKSSADEPLVKRWLYYRVFRQLIKTQYADVAFKGRKNDTENNIPTASDGKVSELDDPPPARKKVMLLPILGQDSQDDVLQSTECFALISYNMDDVDSDTFLNSSSSMPTESILDNSCPPSHSITSLETNYQLHDYEPSSTNKFTELVNYFPALNEETQ